MRNIKIMKKEFEMLERSIERLKKAENELVELDPGPDVFGTALSSIRAKLKKPSMVNEVEKELDNLRKIMTGREAHREYEKGKATETATLIKPTVPSSSLFPRELGNLYVDPNLIGSGGFARVFQAKRRKDGTIVAVKVPFTLDALTGKRFVREINNWQQLRHINIVGLYDYNILPLPYLEMEFCDRSLNDLPKPLDVEMATVLMFHIAEGAKQAHSKAIVHRDLKPQNILLKGDIPKISDWGLSGVVTESKNTSSQILTPLYAAPEQLAPHLGRPDYRTDIYQLGAIFYELVTGAPPFRADNMIELMAKVVNTEPDSPSWVNPAACVVEPIIMKCLRKQMSERYTSVIEMQRYLADYLRVKLEDSLKERQRDSKREAFCYAELCLIHLRLGNPREALRNAVVLKKLSNERTKVDLGDLISDLEALPGMGLSVPEDKLDRVSRILYQRG